MGSMRLLPNLWSWEKSGLSNFRFDAEGDASREDDGDVDGASALVGSESCRWVASGLLREDECAVLVIQPMVVAPDA